MHRNGFLPVIRRRWLLILVTASLVIGGHLAWVGYGQPQFYLATTRLSVDPPAAGSGSLFLRPNVAANRPETFEETPVLVHALRLLSGERSFASRVFGDPARKEEIKRFTERFAAEVAGGGGTRILGEIEESIGVTTAGDGRTIAIAASSTDPERALAISWAVAEAARAFHQERSRELVGETVADLQEQRAQLEKERQLALEDKTEFARRTGFTNLPRYLEMVEGMISETEAEQSRLRFQQREVELVEERSEIAFRLEVLKERQASLTREFFQLTELSQEYNRLEERAATVVSHIDRIRGQIEELEWSGVASLGQVELHDPGESAKPQRKPGAGAPAIGLAALVGVLFACGVTWVLEVLDTRLKTEEDVQRYLGLPLLGVIPVRKDPLLLGEEEGAERFNTIATLVRSTARELGMKSFMVASSVAGEGKSTVSIN